MADASGGIESFYADIILLTNLMMQKRRKLHLITTVHLPVLGIVHIPPPKPAVLNPVCILTSNQLLTMTHNPVHDLVHNRAHNRAHYLALNLALNLVHTPV